ncbi:MAG: hypothetical protein AAF664_13960 [Planctomycetota bacterium]
MINVVLRLDDGVTLDRLVRLLADDVEGIEIHVDSEEEVWLRCRHQQDSPGLSPLDRMAGDRYEVHGDLLRPVGARLAVRSAPGWSWKSVEQVASIELPRFGVARRSESIAIPMQWTDDRQTRDTHAVRCDLEELCQWVETVPNTRLIGLSWIVQAEGTQALVRRGDDRASLPPVRGEFLVDHGKLLMMAGRVWSPELPVKDLRQMFGANANQWVLWMSSDSIVLLDDSWWVTLDRPSMRTTARSGLHQ